MLAQVNHVNININITIHASPAPASWQLFLGTSEDDGVTIDLTAGDDDTRDFDIIIINRPAGDDDITTNEVVTNELPEVDDSGVHVDERLITLMNIWEEIASDVNTQ